MTGVRGKDLRALLGAMLFSAAAGAGAAPFTVAENLFDIASPSTLGLPVADGTESAVVYRAVAEVSQYNHGAVLFAHNGLLYAQWQSSRRDEDAPDTRVLYASSHDGLHWSAARELMPARNDAVVTSGGWWSDGGTLYAFINVWPEHLEPRGGHVEVLASKDGEHWQSAGRPTFIDGQPLNGVIEQDFHAYPLGDRGGARIVTALHRQPGLQVVPIYTDDPSGLTGWRLGNFDNTSVQKGVSREIEPSNFRRRDGALVMAFRDQQNSFRVLAAVSNDNGEQWTVAEPTNFPDSRAKQSAGNLPDGSAFLVNNPSGSKAREPLVVSLSKDGELFDRAFLLRAGGQQLAGPRFEGLYKRKGFSYPKSLVWKSFLYVAYADNKEDIVVTRVPLASLVSP